MKTAILPELIVFVTCLIFSNALVALGTACGWKKYVDELDRLHTEFVEQTKAELEKLYKQVDAITQEPDDLK